MNKIVLAVIAGASLCVLSACSTYTEATGPNGGAVKHIAIAPGTSIITAGGCINSAGGACDQQAAPAVE